MIERVASHRNGISGASFHVVLFSEPDDEHSLPHQQSFRQMIGVVFEEDAHVAVFDRNLVGKGNVDFYFNSWRGDDYEAALRRAVRDYRLAQQLLPTEKWAAGWSPETDPLPTPDMPAVGKRDRVMMGKLYGVNPDEIPLILQQLRIATDLAEHHGGTVYVVREDDTWKIVRDVFPTEAAKTSPRVFDVQGPDRKAQKDRQADRDLLGMAMADLLTGAADVLAGPTSVEPAKTAYDMSGKTVLTLDDLIAAAVKARDESPLGGDTVVHLCEREREYVPSRGASLDVDEDGAVFLVEI